jgi:7-cyano-7-deazaguanine synthase
MQRHALEGYADITLYAPYVNIPKAGIVTNGAKYNTPFAETWSCYNGGARHCGRCGTCVERREAFHLAGIEDPTDYEDRDFWLEALQKGAA